MEAIEPAAIRAGLRPAELETMTIAEIEAVIEGVTERQKNERGFMDVLNGKFCAVYASFHGVESCPADYSILKSDDEPDLSMTPDDIADRAFRAFQLGSAS